MKQDEKSKAREKWMDDCRSQTNGLRRPSEPTLGEVWAFNDGFRAGYSASLKAKWNKRSLVYQPKEEQDGI